MSGPEIQRQLSELMEKGFDDSFVRFCGRSFSSHQYPPGNLAAAKMYAFYLRLYIGSLFSGVTGTPCEGIPQQMWELCREVGDSSIERAESAEAFCREFVKEWCGRLSSDKRD